MHNQVQVLTVSSKCCRAQRKRGLVSLGDCRNQSNERVDHYLREFSIFIILIFRNYRGRIICEEIN